MSFVKRDPTRKVHITRILGTNKDGDVLDDIWADVERFEVFATDTQVEGQYQKINTKFRWHDDPDDPDEYMPEDDEGTARNTEVLKVCSPDEEDLEDPKEWIPVRVIKEIYLHEAYKGVTQKRLTTDKLDKERQVKYRRIFHYDTNIDDEAEAAFEADPARKAYVVKGSVYQKDDETKDEDQYVEAELVKAILKHDSDHEFSTGASQQTYLKLKNQYLLDETEEAKLEELGENDKNPPYRLDPFQNIINISFGGGGVFAASNATNNSTDTMDMECLRVYLKTKTADEDWISAQTFAGKKHFFTCTCGVYGNPDDKPTFILAGADEETTYETVDGIEHQTVTKSTFVVTSTDGGKTWNNTYVVEKAYCEVAAYNETEQAFYIQIINEAGEQSEVTVIKSLNGTSWRIVERTPIPASGSITYASPLILEACSSIYKDASGKNCPAGIYGYDKSKKIVIAPYPDIDAYSSAAIRHHGEQVKIIKHDDDDNVISTEITSIPGITDVYSVAFAGGIWAASGHDGTVGVISTSTDSGITWEVQYTGGLRVVGVIGAPKTDFLADVLGTLKT